MTEVISAGGPSVIQPPGVVIHHVPASTRCYVGCPSIAVLPEGKIVASHSYFGHGARNTDSFIYESLDSGISWRRIAELHGQIWSNLFIHNGDLYIMGTDHCDRYGGRLNGRVVIRRSRDGGETWTEPKDEYSGLLLDQDGYHTAAVPVVVHNGRVWRAMEFAPEPERMTWTAGVMSAPEDADLLRRDSWTMSEQVSHLWSSSQWIEGNVVVDRNGNVVDILRTNWRGKDELVKSEARDQAVILTVSENGISLSFDRENDIIRFPGAGTKFTIRYDSASELYWTLSNKQTHPDARRNRLYLSSSPDLRKWRVRELVLDHPDIDKHAFQYVDWSFDGQNIMYVSRTAHDDGQGGAHSYHDANFLTFHRVENFRQSGNGIAF